jgi:hypothetical protein
MPVLALEFVATLALTGGLVLLVFVLLFVLGVVLFMFMVHLTLVPSPRGEGLLSI